MPLRLESVICKYKCEITCDEDDTPLVLLALQKNTNSIYVSFFQIISLFIFPMAVDVIDVCWFMWVRIRKRIYNSYWNIQHLFGRRNELHVLVFAEKYWLIKFWIYHHTIISIWLANKSSSYVKYHSFHWLHIFVMDIMYLSSIIFYRLTFLYNSLRPKKITTWKLNRSYIHINTYI